MAQPIVGIVGKHMKLEKYSRPDRPYEIFYDEVRQAVIDHSATPIGILSPSRQIERHPDHVQNRCSPEELSVLEDELRLCQGLIFQGGRYITDIEYEIARLAYERDIPTLGICCGQTVIVEAFGGELAKVDETLHERKDDQYVHDITVLPNTKFREIVGVDTMRVNSRHTRSAVSCPILRPAALDPEGNLEVLEAPDKKFFLAMRFHPESLCRTDPVMSRIFAAFVAALE